MDQENIPDSTNASNSIMAKLANVSSDSLFVPNWLLEVFEWIKRSELINSPLNTASRIFQRICWVKLHGNVPPRRLPHLLISCNPTISYQKHQQLAKKIKLQIINKYGDKIWAPIPLIRPPDYFIGIRNIKIDYLNVQIFEFLKNIAHLLENRYLIFTNDFQINGWENEEQRIMLMREFLEIMASKISILELPYYSTMFFRSFFRRYPNIIDTTQGFYVNGFEFDDKFLLDWVTKPHCEGKQKILLLKQNQMFDLINRIKKEFRASTPPANFFISAYDCAKFRMENDRTGEVLELYEKLKNSAARYLVRYPKGEEEYWKRNGQNKIAKISYFCDLKWLTNSIGIFEQENALFKQICL